MGGIPWYVEAMRCPKCQHPESRVLDSRQSEGGRKIRRRRNCEACDHRFTTYEVSEAVECLVLKKDGRREPLDPKKLLRGIEKACEKRPVSYESLEAMAERVLDRVAPPLCRETSVEDLGNAVLDELRPVDPVAYVRFMSVFCEFSSAEDFLKELSRVVTPEGSSSATLGRAR